MSCSDLQSPEEHVRCKEVHRRDTCSNVGRRKVIRGDLKLVLTLFVTSLQRPQNEKSLPELLHYLALAMLEQVFKIA
jgi:hypothetical protein